MSKKTSKEVHHDSPGRNNEGQNQGGDLTSWQLGPLQTCKNDQMWCYLSLSLLLTSFLGHSSCLLGVRGTVLS